jgi:hypothetical protein
VEKWFVFVFNEWGIKVGSGVKKYGDHDEIYFGDSKNFPASESENT